MLKEPETYEEKQYHLDHVAEIFESWEATEWDLLPEYYQHLIAARQAVHEAGRPESVQSAYYKLAHVVNGVEHLPDCTCKRCAKANLKQIRQITKSLVPQEATGCPYCDCEVECDNVVGCDDCCQTCSTCFNIKETQNKIHVKRMKIMEVNVRIRLGTTSKRNGAARSVTADHYPYCTCPNCIERNRAKAKYWQRKAIENGIEV